MHRSFAIDVVGISCLLVGTSLARAQDCGAGTVDGAAGPRAVLFVNGSAGLPGSHVVGVDLVTPITLHLDAAPGGPATARYLLWLWNGPASNAGDLVVSGQTLGCLVNPTPLRAGALPQPVRCLRGVGSMPTECGVPQRATPSTAPFTITRRRGVGAPGVFTVQGIIEDASAANSSGFSVTNAVTLVASGGGSAPFVPPPPGGTATRYVAPTGSDAANGTTPQTAWRSLQWAADHVSPGDVVDVADGHYARFTISIVGTQQSPVIFRATGSGAVIDSGMSSSLSPDRRDAIKVDSCEWLTIHGLRTANAFRAGARITNSLHVTIQAGVFATGGTWGIFTDYSDDVALIGNECFGSIAEHGIYHSNSGDRAILRGNYCHDNHACGIQINADPSQQDGSLGTRGDGIAQDCVIEQNLCTRNGVGGGAALNFASIRNCEVRNNLLVNNFGQSGIVLWDGGYGTQWGSMGNRVQQNTVVFQSGNGRFCLNFSNGSTGNRARNNVFRGGARGAITFTSDSLSGFDEDYDLLSSTDSYPICVDANTDATYTLAQWRTLTGGGAHDQAAVPVFTNAAAGDFTLTAASPGVNQGAATGVAGTYDGNPRPIGVTDMGCFER
ncbi:MAG: right-handed parallel beta-helix repeat-containing protein [Planctomycetes bacterium]|nr:right-handed parallel beta-helix repeat-containing protein [Planctomycetota bacterium]